MRERGEGEREKRTGRQPRFPKKNRPSPPFPSPTPSLAAVRSPASDADLESTFGFQLEAVTKQLRDELDLIPRMGAWAPWDVPAGETRELRIERPVEKAEKK